MPSNVVPPVTSRPTLPTIRLAELPPALQTLAPPETQPVAPEEIPIVAPVQAPQKTYVAPYHPPKQDRN